MGIRPLAINQGTEPMTRSLFVAAVLTSALVHSTGAQTWVTYDAALGTFPQEQCWLFSEDMNPVTAYPLEVNGSGLYFNTMGFDDNWPVTNMGASVYWSRIDMSISFASDFAVEARVKIISAPNHSINMQDGWPRPGFCMCVRNTSGSAFWIGLGTSEIFLSNYEYGHYGSADTVTTDFNTTDDYHVYRIERKIGGNGATLRIDGNEVLTINGIGPSIVGGSRVYIGDGTYWANSEAYIDWVRYTGAGPGPITAITGPDDVDVCAEQTAALSVAPAGTAPFTYQWQIESEPGVWLDLSAGVTALSCGGSAMASAPDAPTSDITVTPCKGVDAYAVRCMVSNECGDLPSSAAMLTFVECCLGDIEPDAGDGVVDINDYTEVILNWNTKGPQGDVDGDGVVDINDYTAVVLGWGDC